MNDNNGMRCKELKDDQRNEEEYEYVNVVF